ncbi:hypothetical protein A2642_03455 [Candidatus Nomurabacteria bacterium RIFCSPHIGHO2_01_FULL_39_10]|uniref:Uncharacterized protein n=1 Tax=Candidatus Nomurabacteria bacterium RIFCSPHIGHO2_01_FULL_39_10 TaxID=1801733 RepID=A0A1F6V9C0_9BACT|nr:MAG: hypothetical protein A2642_03455 [Candidatus Nomurabacteria bacterium RIFCSPHIGHO2_01_FULL_39_10]
MVFESFSFIEQICRYVRPPERLSVSSARDLLHSSYIGLEDLRIPGINDKGIRTWFEDLSINSVDEGHRVIGCYVQQFKCGVKDKITDVWQPTEPIYMSIDVFVRSKRGLNNSKILGAYLHKIYTEEETEE